MREIQTPIGRGSAEPLLGLRESNGTGGRRRARAIHSSVKSVTIHCRSQHLRMSFKNQDLPQFLLLKFSKPFCLGAIGLCATGKAFISRNRRAWQLPTIPTRFGKRKPHAEAQSTQRTDFGERWSSGAMAKAIAQLPQFAEPVRAVAVFGSSACSAPLCETHRSCVPKK